MKSMALLESIDIPLGTAMPSFTLPDPYGTPHTSDALMGLRGLLVVFTCNHCPYAIPQWLRLIAISQIAKPLGINTVAINPNIHPDYPEDDPTQMIAKIRDWHIPFPYLVDSTQTVAAQFKAQCTPDIYLFSHESVLVYHGRLDDNWKDASKVTREELKDAIIALGNGTPISTIQHPSMGCSIKWKSR